MQDRYLPLDKRRTLVNEIENIKNKFPTEVKRTDTQKARFDATLKLQILSVVITLFGVIIGIYSFYRKARLDLNKNEELENIGEEELNFDNQVKTTHFGYEFESKIIEALKSHPGVELIENKKQLDIGYDAEFL